MSATSVTPASQLADWLAERGRIGAFLTHHKTLRWLRYISVSAIVTILSLGLLGVAVGVFDFQAGWSNVVAVLIASAVSFELNRRWVWQSRSGKVTAAQVLPFLALSVAGLALSTVSVHYASHYAVHHHYRRGEKTLLVEIASISAFGARWIFQFFLLDLLLFKARHEHPTSEVGDIA